MERKNAWEKYPEGKKREEVFQFAEDYRKFISECKTERECTTEFAKRAEKAGFVNLDEVLEKGTKLKAGDRVYANNGKRNCHVRDRKERLRGWNEHPWRTYRFPAYGFKTGSVI